MFLSGCWPQAQYRCGRVKWVCTWVCEILQSDWSWWIPPVEQHCMIIGLGPDLLPCNGRGWCHSTSTASGLFLDFCDCKILLLASHVHACCQT